jgi:uncharacterized protein YvpB
MVKKQTTKVATSRRRATNTTKSSVKSKSIGQRKNVESKADKPKYRHYGYYQPSKSTNLTINRRRTKSKQSMKRRTRAEILRKRRIIVTLAICLLVIFGTIAAKIFSGNEKTDQSKIGEVKQSKNIETPKKSEIELKKEQAEQNFSAISGVLKNSSFSTDSIVKLKVPIYRQVYKQSCEAASLRMALAYRGIETTDLKILELMKYDDQPAKKINDEWVWGDPHKTYVGNKDGDQTKMTGYGVFGEPIAAASEKLGRPATTQNEVKPEWLARQIYAGNPVILWGVSIKIADAKWKTPGAKEIVAPMRTHTRLVIGVRGDPSQPIGFYINDPAGMEIYWTTAQLINNVAAGIGQGVAIY